MWGAIISAVAPALIGSIFGGGKKGEGQQQQAGGSGTDPFEAFMKMGEAAASRKGELQGITQRGKSANIEIAEILQREIQNSYGGNTEAAIKRIFGPNGAYQKSGINALPPRLQETLRSE